MSETKNLFKLADIFAQKLKKMALKRATIILDALPPNVRQAVRDLVTSENPDVVNVYLNPGFEAQQAQTVHAVQAVAEQLWAAKRLDRKYTAQFAQYQ